MFLMLGSAIAYGVGRLIGFVLKLLFVCVGLTMCAVYLFNQLPGGDVKKETVRARPNTASGLIIPKHDPRFN